MDLYKNFGANNQQPNPFRFISDAARKPTGSNMFNPSNAWASHRPTGSAPPNGNHQASGRNDQRYYMMNMTQSPKSK